MSKKYRQHHLEGQRFSRLVVLRRAEYPKGSVICECDCGAQKAVFPYFLVVGKVKSCGCLKRDRGRILVEKYRPHYPERNAKIISLFDEGEKAVTIAELLGISDKTAYAVIGREKRARERE